MSRHKSLQENRYFGYHSKGIYYVCQSLSKSAFAKRMKDITGDGISWITERICAGSNEAAMVALSERPNLIIALSDDNKVIESFPLQYSLYKKPKL